MSDENKTALEVKEAIDRVQARQIESNEAINLRLKEIEAKGAADPLLDDKIKRIADAQVADRKTIEDFALTVKRMSRNGYTGQDVDLDVKAQEWAAQAGATEAKAFNSDKLGEYKAAFMGLVRKNFDVSRISDVERKALSVGEDTSGGFFVYPDLSGRIVKKVFETSPMRAYASVQAIGTDALEGYYDNDEVGYGWVSEMEARSVTATPVVGKWSIPVHEMFAMPESSQKILDDAIMDMEGWLNTKIADRFARAENAAFISGDGTGQPRGFLNYPNGTDLTNSVERIKTGINGGFAATPDGHKKLMDAKYKLKSQYRSNMTWFMNSGTTSALMQLQDSNGRFLWQDSVAAGTPATFMGYSVATFEDMPDIATGSLSIALGDMRSAYQIVDRIGIRMLRDNLTTKGRVKFYATKRTGGDMINGEALKFIEFSA
jgi:HK97 family phage major capsid protein